MIKLFYQYIRVKAYLYKLFKRTFRLLILEATSGAVALRQSPEKL